jgi:iron complex outermembrane recepter protein
MHPPLHPGPKPEGLPVGGGAEGYGPEGNGCLRHGEPFRLLPEEEGPKPGPEKGGKVLLSQFQDPALTGTLPNLSLQHQPCGPQGRPAEELGEIRSLHLQAHVRRMFQPPDAGDGHFVGSSLGPLARGVPAGVGRTPLHDALRLLRWLQADIFLAWNVSMFHSPTQGNVPLDPSPASQGARQSAVQGCWPALPGARRSAVPGQRVALFLAGACLFSWPTPSAARVQEPDTVALPPLVVRVLLSPLPQDATPLSVSVLGREDLVRGKSGTFLEEALQAIPGLQVQNRFNHAVGERILLRGTGARAQFGMRGIRILVDGIPATLPDGQSSLDHLDLRSLGRAEILRGPASSLYGNGAGGVLRLSSLPPQGAHLRQETTAQVGSQGLRELSSVTSGTMGGTGYLLSLGALELQGFRPAPQEGEGFYGAARRRLANGQIHRPLAGGTLVATVNLLDMEAENPGALTRALLMEGSRNAAPFNVSQNTGKDVRQAQAGVSWQGSALGSVAQVAVWGIRRHVWNPIPPAVVDLSRGAGGVRGELQGRWATGTSMVHWVAGAEAELQRDRRRSFDNLQGSPGTLRLDQGEAVLGMGVFTQGILELSGGARFLAGARLHDVRFRVQDHLQAQDAPDASGSRSMGALSPTAGFTVPLGPWISARGSISTVFQTPTTSELANRPSGAGGFNPALEPQRGVTLEGGIRAGSERGSGAEITLFHSRFTDELVPFEVPGAPGRVYFRNAGQSRHRGLESGAFLVLPWGITARIAYTYLDARFRRFEVDGRDLAGNRIPGIPKHRVESVGTWRRRASEGGFSTFVEVRALYQGSVAADDLNTDAAGAFALLDLRGGLGDGKRGNLLFSPYGGVSNALDRRYTASVAVNAAGGRYFEPGPGRAFHVGLRVVWVRE